MTGAPGAPVTYSLHQSIRYDYPGPIRHLAHRLMIVPPPVHGDQRRLAHRVDVRQSPARVVERVDGFGNHVIDVRAELVEAAIEFDAWIDTERAEAPLAAQVPTSQLSDPRLLEGSPLTTADGRLADAARTLAPGPGGQALAERICGWAHSALVYDGDATDVWTTGAEALALGRGVCQDYAHVMLAVCRLCRLPARYVSGHLRGEGGTHAWVEVLLRDDGAKGEARAVPYDPTHARSPGPGYVTVAVGRDYGDVAPTSGTYDGPWPGQLSVRKLLTESDQELSPSSP